jgi:L-lactate dehydrogenase complex protein LldG
VAGARGAAVTARDAIFRKIRRALHVTGEEPDRRRAVAARLAHPKPNLVPARGRLPHAERIDLFCRMAEKVAATVARVADAEAVPEEVADYLRRNNLPASFRMGADERLVRLPWARAPHLERLTGASDGRDLVGLSHALAGVAETGTLALASGPDNPNTLNYLPDTHVVVVAAADIVGDVETVWARLRERFGSGALPRTVSLVTGPSRSGDIEQTIILGAHGPRALHVVVVGD